MPVLRSLRSWLVAGMVWVAGCSATPDTPPVGVLRRADLDFVCDKLESVYSYFEIKQTRWGLDYGQLQANARAAVAAAADDAEHRAALTRLLGAFHDGHLRLVEPKGSGDEAAGQAPAVHHRWVGADGKILVTEIHRLWGNPVPIRAALDEGLRLVAGARALIVDLRGNGGGDDRIAYDYIARLFAREIPLGYFSLRMSPDTMGMHPHYRSIYSADPARPGFSGWRADAVTPATDTPLARPIAVLIDGACYSSCESAALAFKNSGGARLYGATPTGGGSANPIRLPLPHTRAELMLPTWIHVMPNGLLLEDNGVAPDIWVDGAADPLAAARADLESTGVAAVTAAQTAVVSPPDPFRLPPGYRTPMESRYGARAIEVGSGVRLNTIDIGRERDKTLIFVHGDAGSFDYWAPQVAAFADRYRVILYERADCGRSESGAPPSYASSVSHLAGLVAALGVGPHVVIGHSRGQEIAAHYFAGAPTGLRGLVAEGTGVSLVPDPQALREAIRTAARLASGDLDLRGDCLDQFFPFGRTLSPALGLDLAAIESLVRYTCGHWRPSASLLGGPRTDIRVRLAAVNLPMLQIDGADYRQDRDRQQTMQRYYKDPRLVLVPSAGHFAHVEQPQAFNRHVAAFLAEIGF